MPIINGIYPINQNPNANVSSQVSQRNENAKSFGDILAKKALENETLQFSKHAEMRLRSRDISLSGEQMQRAVDGVNKARLKGIRDSLVLVDDVALVINTKNSVVITALQGKNDNVFTNIDGAVIV